MAKHYLVEFSYDQEWALPEWNGDEDYVVRATDYVIAEDGWRRANNRIGELEAAISTAHGNLCNGLKVPALNILKKALGLRDPQVESPDAKHIGDKG